MLTIARLSRAGMTVVLSRRGFLAGVAGVSAGAMVGRAPGLRADRRSRRRPARRPASRHVPHEQEPAGRGPVRGHVQAASGLHAPRDELLDGLATDDGRGPDVPDDSHLNTSPRLFAGFTFIGQFIDHDITFDNTPLALQQADPDATVNFRTPRYDLDSVYGRGPVDDPQFYDPADRDKLLVRPNANGVLDMPRDSNGRAIIPESRNDENLIIVQLHKAVAQFHNRIVDYARAQGMRREWVFETARRLTRWHYQWAVIHDFLPRFVGDELVGPNGAVYKEVAGKPPVITLNHYKPTNRDGRPFMPVEFAVAAYRFGHSLIRPFYVINQATLADRGSASRSSARRTASTSTAAARYRPSLSHGVEEHPSGRSELHGSATAQDRHEAVAAADAAPRVRRPAPGPDDPPGAPQHLRGKHVGLPSGQQVARAMRVSVLSNAVLGLSSDPGWAGEAPLWFYILKEAELPPYKGERLGPVGGRIVAEVLVGLLQRDPNSYLYLDPAWKPAPPLAPTTGQFTFVDLLRYAGAA